MKAPRARSAALSVLRLDRWPRWLARIVPVLALGAVIVLTWEAGFYHRVFGFETYTVAKPSAIFNAVAEEGDVLWRGASVTMSEAGKGYLLGGALGFALAVIIDRFGLMERTLLPAVTALAAMPVIALAPLMALYFGRGQTSKVAVVVLLTLPPMVVTVFKGLSSIPNDHLELLVSYGTSPWLILRKLKLPSSIPFAFTGLRVNVPLSLVGAIIAEFFAAENGLGQTMSHALNTFDMPVAWATMGIAALIGVIGYAAVQATERLVAPWDVAFRADSGTKRFER